MQFNASTTRQNRFKMAGTFIYLFWRKKPDIFELIEDSDTENTKRQIEYAVSHMYFSLKSNSLFWYFLVLYFHSVKDRMFYSTRLSPR